MGTPSKPNPDGYWVQPGRLFAGAYPGDQDPARARDKLAACLEAGVQLFVDLTEDAELAPYAELIPTVAAGVTRPARHRRFPIPDFGVPTTAQMAATLEAVGSALAAGEVVYLHCRGGIGRTGTVVGCHLVEGGLDGEAALERIAELRGGLDEARSPETEEQRRLVRGWSRVTGSRRP